MGLKVAACIINGVVVNTAVYDESESQVWAENTGYDKVIIVDSAAIGWVEYEPNKVRAVKPSDKHVWSEVEGWQLPKQEEVE
jgi:hypothetical protein